MCYLEAINARCFKKPGEAEQELCQYLPRTTLVGVLVEFQGKLKKKLDLLTLPCREMVKLSLHIMTFPK